MSEEPTYYFILPDVDRPVGGVNVLLQYIDILNAEGYRAAPLYRHAHYQYEYSTCAAPGFYSRDLQTHVRRISGRRARLAGLLEDIKSVGTPRVNAPLQRKASDVYIIPEYVYPEFFEFFKDARRILAVQGIFVFLRAFLRDTAHSTPVVEKFDTVLATSEASYRAVRCVTDTDCHTLKLSVEKPGLNYKQEKKLQIAYMPRRRREEVEIVITALKNRADMADVTFVEIENISSEEVCAILRDSLMFLSFSYKEGFGLPPAEAMAAGCLVVGYTGVGGDEYFTKDVGFPINDSDVTTFIETVETVVTEHRADPKRLDAMRKKASKRILETYNAADARANLLSIWKEIHQQFTS
jgi:glycosyltransferase involved in cell wall biosynthesis